MINQSKRNSCDKPFHTITLTKKQMDLVEELLNE